MIGDLWAASLFFDEDDEEEPHFTGCWVSKEKKIFASLMNYAKILSCPGTRLLDEDAPEVCIHIDDDVPVVLQLTGSEICDMVMNANKDNESDDNEDVATIERMIRLTEELIHGMEQSSFATEHHIMSTCIKFMNCL
jgi:hypothetical protein